MCAPPWLEHSAKRRVGQGGKSPAGHDVVQFLAGNFSLKNHVSTRIRPVEIWRHKVAIGSLRRLARFVLNQTVLLAARTKARLGHESAPWKRREGK
jgi:hypothetical protein